MRQAAAARTPPRRTLGATAVGLLVVTVAIVGTLAIRPPSPSAPSFIDAPARETDRAVSMPQPGSSSAPSFSEAPRGDRGAAPAELDGAVTEDDGALPGRVTVFDDEYPAVANLDPGLLRALRAAATEAAEDGIELHINSGWRSPEYQNELLREAVSKYGSEKEAARWVATADTSAHVSGDAVDVGPFGATAWLSEHGAEYGLCQIYRNEPWHHELRPAAIERGCPPVYADSAHDRSTKQ